MSTGRIVVTGIGCVTAAGIGVDALWRAARSGDDCSTPLRFTRGAGHHVRVAAQVRESLDGALDAPRTAAMDRVALFAVMSARAAVAMSGLQSREMADGTAVVIGTGIGGAGSFDDGCHALYVERRRVPPLTIPRVMPSAPASQISMDLGIRGPVLTVSSACASSTQAIGLGLQLLRARGVERVLVGGSEALITPAVMRGWEAMRVLASEACRPFSSGRQGMVVGEGAAVLVLETHASAVSRGARVLAEVAGYGTSSDAGDLLRPDPHGAARAIAAALQDANVPPEAIGYVNAHGTGTVLNDIAESRALHLAFGEVARRVPVSSTKPVHGHTLGASGAIECVVTISALEAGIAPPTPNWLGPDPLCDLDVVPNRAVAIDAEYAVSNSCAFGGINAALVLRRGDQTRDHGA